MNFDLTFFISSIFLGIGLAMDAFSVSLANGLHEPKMQLRKTVAIAGVFAGFQIAMPMIGWFCVSTIAECFTAFQPFIPWIALALLGYIGGKMLFDGIKGGEAETPALSIGALFVQGVATSIDALSVGFTIANYDLLHAAVSCALIGIVTFIICLCGIQIGKTAGTRLAGKASIFGGLILITIGLEIFITNMLS